MSYVSVDFVVTGKVQGVFFRKYTKLEADKLGIVGIVRNMEDGSVQGVAQGTEANVKRMCEWLKHTGSPKSRIETCTVTHRRKVAVVEYASFVIDK